MAFSGETPLVRTADSALAGTRVNWAMDGSRVAVARFLARIRLSANVLTILGFLLCLCAGLVVAGGHSLGVAAFLFAWGSACDAIDGVVARLSEGTRTRLGGFLDSFCDKAGELAVIRGIMYRFEQPWLLQLAAAAAIFALLTTFAKASAFEHRILLDWSEVKLFGRVGRVVILIAGLTGTAILIEHEVIAVTLTITTLLAFNIMTFATRLWRIIRTSTLAE